MARVQIHGKDHPIKAIFSNDFAFSVPFYQRPYAWTTEEASELIDDLAAFVPTDDKDFDDATPYFLGSIVLIKTEESPEADVIDGQQRLTTLTILFSALRRTLDHDMGGWLNVYLYEKGNPIEGTPDRPRLRVRDRDSAFFEKYVQRDGGLDALAELNEGQLDSAEVNFKRNAALYVNRLLGMSDDRRVMLAKYIANKCYLVAVSTSDLESAYRIFTVLNDRGLDLSHADILKAEVIGKLPSEVQEQYAKQWEDLEEDLGREAFAELFAHVRMIFVKAKLRETVLKEFRDHVAKKFSAGELFDTVLVPYARAFEQVRTMSYESAQGADEVNRSLTWLNRIDNFDWVPAALVMVSKFGQDADQLAEHIRDLERLAATMMVRRANLNERLERYGRVLQSLEEGEELREPESSLQLSNQEKTSALQALAGDVYSVVRIRQYVLLRLDSALSSGGATYDFPLISVEHVLPQNPPPGSEWLANFPDDEAREGYTHLIGNLVLLTRRKNSEARNFDFEKKKNVYFLEKGVSPFALTSQVIAEPEWTPAVIQRRQEALVELLAALWRLN